MQMLNVPGKKKSTLVNAEDNFFGFGSQERSKHVVVSFINRACLLLSHCRTINFLSK